MPSAKIKRVESAGSPVLPIPRNLINSKPQTMVTNSRISRMEKDSNLSANPVFLLTCRFKSTSNASRTIEKIRNMSLLFGDEKNSVSVIVAKLINLASSSL